MSMKFTSLFIRIFLSIISLNGIMTQAVDIDSFPKLNNETTTKYLSARGIGRILANCLNGHDMTKCFKQEVLNVLEAAAKDNSTWHYSDILTFEKQSPNVKRNSLRSFRLLEYRKTKGSFSDILAEKLFNVARTRSLRFQLPEATSRLNGISGAVDDIFTSATASSPVLLTTYDEEGTVRLFNGLVDDKIEAISNSGSNKKKKKKKDKDKDKDKNKDKKKKKDKNKDKSKDKKKKIWYLNSKNPLKGRKKKDKDKNMAMMGGMAMMAMVAQMFLGKVILIAGAAFIMAKIALLISVLGSLKKGSSGSSGSGGTTEHVIISGGGGGGGGHSHDSGWHRSMPHDYPNIEAYSDEHHNGPPISVEHEPSSPSINTGGFKPSYYTVDENEVQESSGFL